MGSHPPREAPAAAPGRERSLGQLFRELTTDSSRLIRQEFALARAEMRQNVRALSRDLARMGVGGALALAGLLTLLVFVIALLGDLLGDEYWLSALIVSVVLLAVGGWLLRGALNDLRSREMAPRDTLASLRSTQRWASTEVQELRSVIAGDGAADGRAPHRPALDDGRGGASTGGGFIRLHGQAVGWEPPPAAAPAAAAGSPPRGDAGRPDPQAAAKEGGLLPLLKRVFHEISDDDIPGQAAKVAYYTFMALPSAILVVFSLTGIFGGPDTGAWMADQLQSALPASASELIGGFVEQVVQGSAPAPLSIGLLLALWAASGAFVGFMVTLNTAYDVDDDRSFVKKRAIALGVMLAFTLLVLVASVALVAGPHIAEALGPGSTGEVIWNIVHWPLAFAFVVAAFWTMYYVLPNRDQAASKGTLLKAAAAAAVLWVAATAAFRFYVANFGSYSETYGILGGFIVLLLWLYITGLVVLAGGELASEMEEGA